MSKLQSTNDNEVVDCAPVQAAELPHNQEKMSIDQIESLANDLGLSREMLHRAFREVMHPSPLSQSTRRKQDVTEQSVISLKSMIRFGAVSALCSGGLICLDFFLVRWLRHYYDYGNAFADGIAVLLALIAVVLLPTNVSAYIGWRSARVEIGALAGLCLDIATFLGALTLLFCFSLGASRSSDFLGLPDRIWFFLALCIPACSIVGAGAAGARRLWDRLTP